jgi:hypothetical protein
MSELQHQQRKSLAAPSPVIAAAIKALLTHNNLLVKEEAKKALIQWSPTFRQIAAADKAYEGPAPVESTERFVGETTPLYVGQIVQVQEYGTIWFPAEVLEVFDDMRVSLRLRGGAKREVTVTRRAIQLGPAELTQTGDPTSAAGVPQPTLVGGRVGSLPRRSNFRCRRKRRRKTCAGRWKTPVDSNRQIE